MAVAAANKIVRGDDLTTVAGEIDKHFQRKVDGKGLSTNDYTTDEKTKLAGIESGAQKNVKPDWNAASGSAAEILNKPAAVQPATVAPKMDGTAAVGSSAKYAKEDHVHPSDTSKANVNNPQFTGSLTIGGSGNQSVEISNFGEIIYTVGSNENSVHLPDNTDLDDVLATQSYVSTAVSNKANKAKTLAGYGITDAYTKTQTDAAIEDMVKAEPIGSIIPPVNPSEFATKEEVSLLGQEIDNFGEPANITETQSVASGERFMKTINLSAYVGQPIKFKVTKNGGTGGTSVGFIVYNADENYTLGSYLSYGLEYEYVINSAMQSLRFMGMALEESSADFEIEIKISTLYKIENVEKAKLIQKEVDYSSQLINGKYYNTANAILPNSPATLAGCQCVTGLIGEGDTLIVKGTGSSNVVSLYAFYDKDKNKLFSSANACTHSLDALEIIAPAGSYYFAFNTYNDTQADCVRVKHIYIIEEEINKIKESNAELSSRVDGLNGLLWEGKKVVCFGDSITEFADSANKRYTDYLAEITKANVINVGIGGTRLACRTTPVANPSNAIQGYAALDCANLVDAVCTNDFSIVDAGAIYVRDNEGDDNTRIVAILKAIDWSSVDIVTFFIGTNDWGGSQNMGISGVINKNTTLGAVGYVISILLTTYPHLKIYWFTPVVRWLSPRTDENWGGNVKKVGNTLDEFVELIKTEVKKYCTPVCDMYHTLGWNKYNFSEYFYDSDGTHPTKGFPEIARKFASFIIANRTF